MFSVSHCQGRGAHPGGNSVAVEIVLNSVNIFPPAIFFLSPALFRGPSLYPLDRSTQAPVLRWLYPSLPPLPPPPILSFLSGYPVIAEAQCDPGLNTHPTQTLHPHACPYSLCDWQGKHYQKVKKKKVISSHTHRNIKRSQNFACVRRLQILPPILWQILNFGFMLTISAFMNGASICAGCRPFF